MASLSAPELLLQQEEQEREAAELYPEDHDECTYVEGVSLDRQRVYVCKTCVPTQLAGVCYSCSISCHGGHELLELFTKRDFICDCGNSKFNGIRCNLTPDKEAENATNKYNHNFEGRYCRCDQPYNPEQEEDEMHQCSSCEDWFHTRCMKNTPPTKSWVAMVCDVCMRNRPLLKRHRFRPHILTSLPPTIDQASNGDFNVVTTEDASSGSKRSLVAEENETPAKKAKKDCLIADVANTSDDFFVFLGSDWESSLCKCDACSVTLEYDELKDIRQFIETVPKTEDNDEPEEEEAEEEEEEDEEQQQEAAHDLGLQALAALPLQDQETVARATIELRDTVVTGLRRLQEQGVAEITSEHVEQIMSPLFQGRK